MLAMVILTRLTVWGWSDRVLGWSSSVMSYNKCMSNPKYWVLLVLYHTCFLVCGREHMVCCNSNCCILMYIYFAFLVEEEAYAQVSINNDLIFFIYIFFKGSVLLNWKAILSAIDLFTNVMHQTSQFTTGPHWFKWNCSLYVLLQQRSELLTFYSTFYGNSRDLIGYLFS